MKLRELGALSTAAQAGLDVTPTAPSAPSGPPSSVPPVAVADTASVRAVKGQNPTTPDGGESSPATPSQDGTVLGTVGGMSVKVPQGGVLGKAARDDAAKNAQRTADLLKRAQPLNAKLPEGHPFKLSDDQLAGVAADPALYNEWAKGALGIAKDPVATHKQMRDYDVAHPTRNVQSQGPNWQVVTTKDGSMVQVNPKTGETRPIGLEARPQGGAAGGIAARQQAAVIPELTAAAETIDRFSDPTIMSQLSKKAGLFGNYLNTPEGRQLNQAITQFVTLSEMAKGNKRPTEALMQRFHDIYAPAPGDDATTMAQKRRARQTLIQSVTEVAGRTGQTSAAPHSTGTDVNALKAKYGLE